MAKKEDISRRDLLRGAFMRNRIADAVSKKIAPAPAMKQEEVSGIFRPRSFPLFRPPGAVDEETFLEKCTRCGDCIEVCPHDAIILAPAKFRQAAGTPIIDVDVSPCRMCPDTPCISACEPDVLRSDLPLTMGTAVLQTMNCLAWHGESCSVCSDECPVPDAIEIKDSHPYVVQDRCTGCGVCHYVCPAERNAVLVMPLAERPSAPDSIANEG